MCGRRRKRRQYSGGASGRVNKIVYGGEEILRVGAVGLAGYDQRRLRRSTHLTMHQKKFL